MSITSGRRELTDAQTGRKLVQLTSGDCFDYPLYYYIPSMTADATSVVFYRHQADEVQMYSLDVETGVTRRLTEARTPNSLWRPWLQEPGWGVRDQMSALNTVTDEVIYFVSNDIRAVNIRTLADRLLFTLPEDRVPCGLTGVSPDGKWFVFPHADRQWWEASVGTGTEPKREEAQGVRLDVLDLASGETRTLVQINSWLTHSNFYDDRRILFCHPATEEGILMTDLDGGHYQHLRTQDQKGRTCHYPATARGIMYEVANHIGGIYDPDTHVRSEYELGLPGYVHTGCDPEGRLWFYESHDSRTDVHAIYFFPALVSDRPNEPVLLLSDMKTYWLGQRSHFHPRVTPDRKSILFTGGDPANQTNHLFLLDIADLQDTKIEPSGRTNSHGGASNAER